MVIASAYSTMTPFSALPHGLPFWMPVVFVVGAMVGSFLNVVIYRLPIMRDRNEQGVTLPVFNLALPRSRCPNCGHRISVLENIPILSWILLRGRCWECKEPIHWRYPAIELFTGLVYCGLALSLGVSFHFLVSLAVTALLIAVAGLTFDDLYPPTSNSRP